MNTKLIRRILDIANGIILFSGTADLVLWIHVGAMIPSWTMTAMAYLSSVLILVVKRQVK